MALMSDVKVPLPILRVQIASAVDTIVQVSRGSDGSRYVTHVSKVVGYDPQSGYQFDHLFDRFKDLGGGEWTSRPL